MFTQAWNTMATYLLLSVKDVEHMLRREETASYTHCYRILVLAHISPHRHLHKKYLLLHE